MILTPAQWSGVESSHIMTLSEHHGLMPQAAKAWQAMVDAANRDGLELNLVSSFRSFERQQAIWNAKWQGQRPVLDDNNQPVALTELIDFEKALAILRFSALPGASRHHWGSDLDLYSARLQTVPLQLVACEYQAGGPQHPVSQWLDERAAEFEFYRPYRDDLGGVACEPWHLSFAPIALKVEQVIEPKALATIIKASALEGKATLLANIEELFERFVRRVSPPDF